MQNLTWSKKRFDREFKRWTQVSGKVIGSEYICLMLKKPVQACELLRLPVAVRAWITDALLSYRYILAEASGANLNPAVSIGLLVGKRISVERFVIYFVAQVCTYFRRESMVALVA